MVHVEILFERWYLASIISDKTCDIKYDKPKASVIALSPAREVLLNKHHRNLKVQTIRDTIIFSSKEITCSPMLNPDGKLTGDASL